MPDTKDTLGLKEIISSTPENKKCIDCGMARPQWASTTYGVFLCLNCAGSHRSYGVKVSMVKSMSMDVWSSAEKKKMEVGGNARFLEHIRKHGLESLPKGELYGNSAVQEYGKALKEKVDAIFPESRAAKSSHAPRERRKVHSTPSPLEVDVKKATEKETFDTGSYVNMYNQAASSVRPTLESIQSGLTEAFGKAAGYFYSASSTISEQISEKVLAPASAAIKERGLQLSEYVKGKDTNRRAASKGAEKEARQKKPADAPLAGKPKASFDKWD
ncbi:uncharacterized protein NEMAJ01_0387 [Nematocida major]|uniref:uncharacterized protein n=1 Tax=Nematocida major TaxID=1912982 RepID=UPI002007389B|nr:uncharacterized protein NEMAJ01_0387 [Nematocida major]KAH9385491.1 hypothetical protein NEMAJ01_0387 [Nematocida major]